MNQEAESYLRSKERGFLATVGRRGPTVVPICFAYESGRIYTAIDKKPKSKKALGRITNIRKNRQVAFILDTYGEDWRRLSYLLVHGEAQEVKSEGESKTAREMLLTKYPQYRWLNLEGSAIIRVNVKTVKLWKFQP